MKRVFLCLILVVSPLIWEAYSSTAVRAAQRENQPLMAIQVRREAGSSGQAVTLKPGQTVYLNETLEK